MTYQYGTEVEVRQLTEGSDFTVAYSNNINAGTATAVISGIGNYTGSRTVEYTITEKSFDGADCHVPERNFLSVYGKRQRGGTGSAGNTGRQMYSQRVQIMRYLIRTTRRAAQRL